MPNSIYDPIDLTTVPLPKVIETLDYETIYQEVLAQFRALVPDYTLLLESDPVVKVLQAWAYREIVLRERINQVAQSNLLPFATSEDLDNLGAFYNLQRMQITPAVKDVLGNVVIAAQMETDAAFRFRIQQHRTSTAGPAAHYRFWALSADPRVKDVAVYSPDFVLPIPINMGGKVNVSIMSTDNGGIASEDLLLAVKNLIARDDVRVLTDIVEVIPATPRSFTVQANLKLYPNISLDEITAATTRLQTAFNAAQALGRDITLSWLTSAINSDRIQSVELVQPAANLVVAPNEFPVMDSASLLFDGYSDSEGYGAVELDSVKAQREVDRLYVKYAIANKRTQAQILTDLQSDAPAGVIEPTLRTVCSYLSLLGTKDTDGNWLPDDELAFLIWRNLSPQYASS